jgi:hypothetical protein
MKFVCVLSILLSVSFAFSSENSNTAPPSAESSQSTQGENQIKMDLNSQAITKGPYVVGGVVGTVVGFGLGHAAQSRTDSSKMKFFMVSEAGVIGGSLLALVAFTSNECTQGGSEESKCLSSRQNLQNNILTAGAFAFVGLRLWEIYDLWSYPYTTDKKSPQVALYIYPQSKNEATANLFFNF